MSVSQVTNEAIGAPMSVLRAMYEDCGSSIKEFVDVVQSWLVIVLRLLVGREN